MPDNEQRFNDPDHEWWRRVTNEYNDNSALFWDSPDEHKRQVDKLNKSLEAKGRYKFKPSEEIPVNRGLYATRLNEVPQTAVALDPTTRPLGNHWTTDEEIAHHAAAGAFNTDAAAHPSKWNVILKGTVSPKHTVEVNEDDDDEWFNHRGVTPDSGEEEVTIPSGGTINNLSAIQYGPATRNKYTDEITPGKIERALYLGKGTA